MPDGSVHLVVISPPYWTLKQYKEDNSGQMGDIADYEAFLTELDKVERLFSEVTERCVRCGSHTAVRALEKAMLHYLDQRNENPKPFVWTADADLIRGKVATF